MSKPAKLNSNTLRKPSIGGKQAKNAKQRKSGVTMRTIRFRVSEPNRYRVAEGQRLLPRRDQSDTEQIQMQRMWERVGRKGANCEGTDGGQVGWAGLRKYPKQANDSCKRKLQNKIQNKKWGTCCVKKKELSLSNGICKQIKKHLAYFE